MAPESVTIETIGNDANPVTPAELGNWFGVAKSSIFRWEDPKQRPSKTFPWPEPRRVGDNRRYDDEHVLIAAIYRLVIKPEPKEQHIVEAVTIKDEEKERAKRLATARVRIKVLKMGGTEKIDLTLNIKDDATLQWAKEQLAKQESPQP